MRSLRFWTFSRSRSNSCRRNFSEDRGRLEPNFAATRRVVLAIIQHKLTHSPEFVQRKRSEEHTSELQSHLNLVCRLLLEKKNKKTSTTKRRCRIRRLSQGSPRGQRPIAEDHD